MKYMVSAPNAGFDGVVGGVRFAGGRAEMDDGEHGAALAYCRRRGYRVEPVGDEKPEPKSPPKRQSSAKKSSE